MMMDLGMKQFDQQNAFFNTTTDVRLGMPHMDGDGVSREWLLRESCHLHWASIAGDFGAHPSEFRDRSGARVLPSVVACTINGDASQFREDDMCEMVQVVKPAAENGWRSQVDLMSGAKSLRAEIVTAFARRNGPSNRDLVLADLEPALQPAREGEAVKRTNVIRLLGKADRAAAEAAKAPPHLNIPMDRDQHVNGVGLVYFAEIHRMFARAERNAAPGLICAWGMQNRRVHFFNNLDAGDTLEFTTEASVQAFAPSAAVVIRSFAKRASDQAVVACAEAIYRQE